MTQAPVQEWWTTDALAASGLPDVPGTRQGVDALAARQGWRGHPQHARKRKGRGGGYEYHWKLLPARAQASLLKGQAPREDTQPADRGEVWAYFEALPETAKAKARDRLAVVQRIDALSGPLGKHGAVAHMAQEAGSGQRTLWNWLAMVDGVDPADWLAYLAPRHRAATAKRKKATCDPEFLDWLKADYLRLGEPEFKACYDRVVELCEARGVKFLKDRTARRWIEKNVPYVTQVLARQGERGLVKCFPPQIRDRSTLTAMEAVNADCHKIDVFVQWPGIDKPVRPQIAMFQDLYSNKMLTYRVDLDPNKVAVMGAYGELVETYGIPKHCLFDNGMEFANKWLTAGTKTRFRFKVREEDGLGVLPQMGVKIHWATPAHGQAKPIERGFGDFAERIAKHPAFAGAYTGNRPDAKPEDYMSRAIPLEDFLVIFDQEVRKHNARPGRLTDNARGRSFDETFAESYAKATIRKATEEQHRLWLMGQEVRKLHKTHGELRLFDNRYWADWMNSYRGQTITARFNPEDLHEGLYIYALDGAYLGFAECREKVGFFDLVGAQMQAKLNRQRRKAAKKALELTRPLSVEEYAAELATLPQPETPMIEAKVVEIAPVRHQNPVVSKPLPTPDADVDDRLKVFEVDFSKPRDVVAETPVEETAADRFYRALDIERRSEAGEQISEEDARFWERMQRLPEYQAQRKAYEDFGAAAIG